MNFQEKLNSGMVHHRAGRLVEAEKIYRQVLSNGPGPGRSRFICSGILSVQTEKLDEAIKSIRRAIAVCPNNAVYRNDLANVLKLTGQVDQAIEFYRRAIQLKPDLAEVHANLGLVLEVNRQLDEAIACFREAVRVKPAYADAHMFLGNALTAKEQFADASVCYREAIRLKPDFAEAHKNLGDCFKKAGRLDEVVACYQKAISIKPDFVDALINLGNAFKDTGNLNGAIAAYRKVIQLKPDFAAAHSNLIYTLHFHPGFDAGMIFEEHRRWNQQHAEPLKKLIQPHANNRDPDRQLRIGYVSPDFLRASGRAVYSSAVGRTRPRSFRESICYSDVQRSDRFTALIREHADQWRNIVGLYDERAAEMIREDQIDILVDLTMHMADNRMLMFARKPAPVQVTYLAYCSTTGLDTMDYRLTDPHLDPPEMDDAFYSEKSDTPAGNLLVLSIRRIRVSKSAHCRRSTLGGSHVWMPEQFLQSFGGCVRVCGCSCCARCRNPASFSTPTKAATASACGISCSNQGIDPHRLKFASKVSLPDYFALHRQIDIGLDPFPYNGGTTTCDALWMGVPVVTLAGRTPSAAAARASDAISDCRNSSPTPQQYVQIATSLANDLPRLAELRRTLRGGCRHRR